MRCLLYTAVKNTWFFKKSPRGCTIIYTPKLGPCWYRTHGVQQECRIRLKRRCVEREIRQIRRGESWKCYINGVFWLYRHCDKHAHLHASLFSCDHCRAVERERDVVDRYRSVAHGCRPALPRSTWWYEHLQIRMQIRMYTYIHRTKLHAWLWTEWINKCVWLMCVLRMLVCLCMHVCKYIYIYIYTHTHTFMNIVCIGRSKTPHV